MKGKWMQYEIGQLVLVRRHDLSSAQDKEIKKFFLLLSLIHIYILSLGKVRQGT